MTYIEMCVSVCVCPFFVVNQSWMMTCQHPSAYILLVLGLSSSAGLGIGQELQQHIATTNELIILASAEIGRWVVKYQ